MNARTRCPIAGTLRPWLFTRQGESPVDLSNMHTFARIHGQTKSSTLVAAEQFVR